MNVCLELNENLDANLAWTITGRHLTQDSSIKKKVRAAKGHPSIENARGRLEELQRRHPTGLLAIVIDQSAIGTSSRSNPAANTGVMGEIRKAFAANPWDASLMNPSDAFFLTRLRS